MNEIIHFTVPFKDIFSKETLDKIIWNIGWGIGYVAVPREHPLFGKKLLEIDGFKEDIAFSGYWEVFDCKTLPKEILQNPKDYWVFGFDTLRDYDFKFSKKFVEETTEELVKILKSFK